MKKEKRYSGILIKHKNKVLLCKRSEKKTRGGEWSIPSGGVEDDETPINAAYREFFEETTHQIPPSEKLICIDRYFTDNRMYFLFVYKVKKRFFVKIDWEHDDVNWFRKDNLPTPISSQIYDAIQRI